MSDPPTQRAVLRRRHRLAHDLEYASVFQEKLRKSRGPLVVFAKSTDRDEHRLGLSVGRRAGPAHHRVRIKRLIREAFRLERAGFPHPVSGSFDLVVNARAHDAAPLSAYRRWLTEAVTAIAREQAKRDAKADG